MRVKITIDCDNVNEIYGHLHKIKQQIKQEANKLNLELDDEFPKRLQLSDMNCYGEHEVRINPHL